MRDPSDPMLDAMVLARAADGVAADEAKVLPRTWEALVGRKLVRLGQDGRYGLTNLGHVVLNRLRPDVAPASLAAAIAHVEATAPLPRCEHGHALRDGAGEGLWPPCGCRHFDLARPLESIRLASGLIPADVARARRVSQAAVAAGEGRRARVELTTILETARALGLELVVVLRPIAGAAKP